MEKNAKKVSSLNIHINHSLTLTYENPSDGVLILNHLSNVRRRSITASYQSDDVNQNFEKCHIHYIRKILLDLCDRWNQEYLL